MMKHIILVKTLYLWIDGKWGFIDTEGREVIPFIYDYARSFSQDLVFVER